MIVLDMMEKTDALITHKHYSLENGVFTLQIDVGDYDLTNKTITAKFNPKEIETGALNAIDGIINLPIYSGLLEYGINYIQLNFRWENKLEQSGKLVWVIDKSLETGGVAQESIDIINYLINEIDAAKVTADRAVSDVGDIKQALDQSVVDAGESKRALDGSIEAAGTAKGDIEQAIIDNEIVTQAEFIAHKAHNDAKLLNMANAKQPLDIVNYLNNNQSMHPKVLGFSGGWNGYKYWMAYTPYPDSDAEHENPSIAVSNDKINWTTPNGLVNPIEPKPDTTDHAYNNDTHLVYRNDLGRMELWWRYANHTNGQKIIYRKTTMDGVNWSSKEELYTGTDILSPSIIYEDDKYKMWGVDGSGNHNFDTVYTESTDAVNWDSITRLSQINWDNLKPWHVDVVRTDKGYEYIVSSYDKDTESAGTGDLYYIVSQDNNTFSDPVKIIAKSTNPTAFDSRGIYRSSFIKENGKYYVFYSGSSLSPRRWFTALAIGDNLTSLTGFDNQKLVTGTDVSIKKDEIEIGNLLITDYDIPYVHSLLYKLDKGKDEPRYSGMKMLYAYFDDAMSRKQPIPPEEGAIRYNGDTKRHQTNTGSAWVDMTYNSLSTNLQLTTGFGGNIKIVKEPSGVVVMTGIVTGGERTSGKAVTVLPSEYRPLADVRILSKTANAGDFFFYVASGGSVQIYGVNDGSALYINASFLTTQ